MLESNQNNGVHETDGTPGNGAETAAVVRKKRVLTKDLSARIAELEKKIEALGDVASKPELSPNLEHKMAAMAEHLAKLDERVNKIALTVAQFNLTRPGAFA
jgi:hypothetical protein